MSSDSAGIRPSASAAAARSIGSPFRSRSMQRRDHLRVLERAERPAGGGAHGGTVVEDPAHDDREILRIVRADQQRPATNGGIRMADEIE